QERPMEVLSKAKFDLHTSITQKIIAAIEAGAGEYRMPWHRSNRTISRPTNATTGKPYRGVNVVALWAEGLRMGFPSAYWATYRQWQSVGAQVRKGEHGSLILFYKRVEDEAREDEEASDRST